MLYLKCIETPRNNQYYYDLVDFSGKSWNGRTFQREIEAVEYCKDTDKGQYDPKIFTMYPVSCIEIRNY